MSITSDRTEATRSLQFPTTLKDLEYFLGRTGYLRQYVLLYAQVTEPLQRRKTALLAAGKLPPKATRKRTRNTTRTTREPTDDELKAFQAYQDYLLDPEYLQHFNPSRQLYTKPNALKHGFGIMVFYLKHN
jgi:hypothetical protein